GATTDRRPEEAVVGQPFDRRHRRLVSALVGLGVELEPTLLAIGDELVADLGEERGLEVELLPEIAVERPGTSPEDAALSGAESLVAVCDVAGGDLVLVEEVEHPLHRLLARLRIDAGRLEVRAGALEAHLSRHDAPGDGRLDAGARHHDAGTDDLV